MSIGQLLVNARAICHLTPSTHNVVVEPWERTPHNRPRSRPRPRPRSLTVAGKSACGWENGDWSNEAAAIRALKEIEDEDEDEFEDDQRKTRTIWLRLYRTVV